VRQRAPRQVLLHALGDRRRAGDRLRAIGSRNVRSSGSRDLIDLGVRLSTRQQACRGREYRDESRWRNGTVAAGAAGREGRARLSRVTAMARTFDFICGTSGCG
jgi:hypothetical protein